MVIEGGNTTNQEQVFTKVNKINGLLLNQSCAGAMYAYWGCLKYNSGYILKYFLLENILK
jgi:hypothetical protein